MKSYCAGFLFNNRNEVLLVRKNKPEWQKGLLNGIGGKIEEGENARHAMSREFKEEVGEIEVEWDCFHKLFFKDCVVCFFRAFTEEDITRFDEGLNDIGETLYLVNTDIVEQMGCIDNLTWLIPMASKDDYYKMGDSYCEAP